MNRSSVLVVCSIVPFPERRGDPVRVMGFLRALANRTDVTLWCVDSADGDVEGLRSALPDVAISHYPATRRRTLGHLSDISRYVAAIARGVPSWILKRESTTLTRDIAAHGGTWDAVIAIGEGSAQYVASSDLAWHWDKANVLSASALVETGGKDVVERLKLFVDRRVAVRYERRCMSRASSVSVINSTEAARVEQIFGFRPIVVNATVPIPANSDRRPEDGRLLWLGNLSYRSNREGLRSFLDANWSELKARFHLRVVGSDMAEADCRWLSTYDNVRPVGFIEDLGDEMSRAQIGVVPIWSGGGTKMKTLTMMAHGLPLVCTPAAAEGIESATRVYFPADRPEDFSTAVMQAVTDPDRERVGANARDLIATHFSSDARFLSHQFDQLIGVATGRHDARA